MCRSKLGGRINKKLERDPSFLPLLPLHFIKIMAEESVYVDPTTGKQIPMKDGKPCRVCVDFKTWSKIEKGQKPATAKATNSNKESATMATNSGTKPIEDPVAKTTNSETKFDEEWKRNNCPADVKTLGRHTWTLLHTMAAYYPEKPEKKQQESMKTFFESFSEHYPCWFCKVRNALME